MISEDPPESALYPDPLDELEEAKPRKRKKRYPTTQQISGGLVKDRPPTEIEAELSEAIGVSNQMIEAISKLESRLTSVTSVRSTPENDKQPTPRCVLTPLADQIRQLTDQNRENAQRILRLIQHTCAGTGTKMQRTQSDYMDTIVEEPKTETTTTDPDASKGFGEIMQARLEQKTAAKSEEKTPTETAPEPAKEATKNPRKRPAPATTPIGDVLDAALSKAAPEPPKEPSPEDEFADVTDGVESETVKQRMIGMRGKIKTLWEENQTRSRELAELASKVKPPMESEEVKTLLKAKDEEIARANEALLALNIDSHPEFQREFTQPRQKLAQNAAKKLQGYGGNGQALIDALYMPEGIRRDEAISELLENVPDYAKGKITGIVTEIEGLDDRAQEKRANAPKTWEELSARDIEARRKKARSIEARSQECTKRLFKNSRRLHFSVNFQRR